MNAAEKYPKEDEMAERSVMETPATDKTVLKHPDKAFSYGLFSAGLIVDGWIYISGQGPLDMKTGRLVPGTIEEETALTIGHLEAILAEAGATLADVVKCTCYLSDLDEFSGFNKVYGELFPEPRPTRSTVGAKLMKGMKVEIDAVARLPRV